MDPKLWGRAGKLQIFSPEEEKGVLTLIQMKGATGYQRRIHLKKGYRRKSARPIWITNKETTGKRNHPLGHDVKIL